MAKQRIYIDTSVIGGYFDDEFSSDTMKLFNAINIKNGYPAIEIRSPKELLKYEE